MGVPNSEVGYTTPPSEGRPRSSGEHVVALGRRIRRRRRRRRREEEEEEEEKKKKRRRRRNASQHHCHLHRWHHHN
jgi:hypothetical protein